MDFSWLTRSFKMTRQGPEEQERSKVLPRKFLDAALLVCVLLFVVSPVYTFLFGDDTWAALSWKASIATAAGLSLWVLLVVRWFLRPASIPRRPLLSRISRNWLSSPFLYLAVFLLLGLLASALSSWPSAAFFGNYIRHEGWLQYVCYAGFFTAAYHLSRRGAWPWIRSFWLVTALVAAGIGIAERAGYQPFEWSIDSLYGTSVYGASFFINRNHFAYYLCMTAVLSASLWALPRPTGDGGRRPALRRALRIAAPALSVLLFTALAYTLTRGSWIALFAGLFLLGLLLSRKRVRGSVDEPAAEAGPLKHLLWKLRPFLPFGTATLVFAAVLLLDPIMSPDRVSSIVSDLTTIVADPTSNAALAAGTFRWELWTDAVHYIGLHPWAGFGPDTTLYLIEQNDRVHNEYLQYAVSIGIPGLLAWLVFLFSSLRRALPARRKATPSGTVSVEAVAVACAAVTYLISAFFGNSLTYVAPFLFLLLGRAGSEIRRSDPQGS